ncbi:MAG: hypothetical protein WD355_12715 [Balneolaceae bacterium]
MTGYKERLDELHKAIGNWLRPDNRELQTAIERTVDEKLFTFPDIKHQILALKKSVEHGDLDRWVERHRESLQLPETKKIVSLHAGNLPLAGFQDIVAVLLSGSSYLGKLSRKDPWLPESFLKSAESAGLEQITWSLNLDSLAGSEADALIFSGSPVSVGPVLDQVSEDNIVKPDASTLIRTAHYSVAWVGDLEPKTMKDLTEAVFRYGGRGCRSVAVVVSPYPLREISCSFTDYVEAYWLQNPQLLSPPPALAQRAAYNRAIGLEYSWLDQFLIEEREEVPEENFILSWIEGGPERMKQFIESNRQGLQTVYLPAGTSPEILRGAGVTPEWLYTAQRPSIDWKPDGVDTIGWLLEVFQG